jgi:hypothetical protein
MRRLRVSDISASVSRTQVDDDPLALVDWLELGAVAQLADEFTRNRHGVGPDMPAT